MTVLKEFQHWAHCDNVLQSFPEFVASCYDVNLPLSLRASEMVNRA